MTEYEKYFFDVNGYLIVEDILSPEQVKALNEAIDHNPDKIRLRQGELSLAGGSPALEGTHGRGDIAGILAWPEPWSQPFRDLLSHPPALRYMLELIGNGFRYGVEYWRRLAGESVRRCDKCRRGVLRRILRFRGGEMKLDQRAYGEHLLRRQRDSEGKG